MTLMGEQNAFIRNIIANTSKTLYIKGIIYDSTLYLITLNGIVFEIDLTGKIDPSWNCNFDSDTLAFNQDYIFDSVDKYYDIYRKTRYIQSLKANPIIFTNEALREDPIFEQIVTAKSSDGASNYFFTTDTGINTFITLYRGLFNLNKPDKAKLSVHATQDPKILLADFEIFKKKLNMNYRVSFLFMSFNQRRIL